MTSSQKIIYSIVGISIVLISLYLYTNNKSDISSSQSEQATSAAIATSTPFVLTPIMHASMILEYKDAVIYVDPVQDSKSFEGKPAPTIILVTDIHGDHLSTTTLAMIMSPKTKLVVPEAVKKLLPENFLPQTITLSNDQSTTVNSITITAVPMYNLPISSKSYHTEGRGNGYIIEANNTRTYIAGDTSVTPEMKALKNIDTAFIPMNLPYTMSVEEAAEGVLTFAPKHIYPYHYRGTEGLSDITKFKELVNKGNPSIDVVLLDWYAAAR